MAKFSSLHRRAFLMSTAAILGASALPRFAFAQEAAQGGVLTVNVGSEPTALLSATNTGSAISIGPKIVEGLLAYDLDFNPLPQLATEWSVSADGLTYNFKLRQGVKWHDGKDFTAEDAAFSILTAKQVHPRGRGTYANVTAANVLGSHEFEIVLSKPAPYLLKALAALETPILPKHLFEGTDVPANPVLNAPVGTGPFIFKEWVRGSHVLVERNPNYWDAGKPHLDQIVFRFISDPAAAVAALESGEVLVSIGVVPLTDLARLKQDPRFVFETRGNGYINSILRGLFNLDRKELQDVRVRQAIAHVIDKQFIVDTVFQGYAKPLTGPVNPAVAEYYTADVPGYALDIDLANSLLDEAGYPRGADGTRFALFIDPMIAVGPQRQIAEYIAQQLSKIGIAPTIRTGDFGSFVKRVYTDRDFDLAIEPMSNLFDPTVGIQRLYWSKNIKIGVPFSNGANYISAETDRLLETAAFEIDPAKRVALFGDFQREVVKDLPVIDLVAPDSFTIFDKRVLNIVTTVDGNSANGADISLQPV